MLYQKAAQQLNDLLKLYQDKPLLLLLSGGSSFAILDHIDVSLLAKDTPISMSDERYSADPKINNFSILKETAFYKKVKENGNTFIDTSIQHNETIDELAERFEKSLREWRTQNPNGIILATMGMGPDGHTCGIMPFPEDPEFFRQKFDGEKWAVGYDAGNKNEYSLRITITFPFIRMIDHAVMYVSGENKRPALEKATAEKGTPSETPARIWRKIKDKKIFTDITGY